MPSEQALTVGQYASDRVSGRPATIRKGFICSDFPDERPPLTKMLVGGQGGEVRLKLYISMLFIAVAEPYNTQFPTRAWAELLDLPGSAEDGIRRLRDALHWLGENRFAKVTPKPGKQSDVLLLSDEGTGEPYKLVSAENNDRWIQLPPELWSKGWIASLSGRALAMLLVLLEYAGRVSKRDETFWVPPSRAGELYSLSPEIWTRGTDELENYGLVTTTMVYFKDHPMATVRRRKEYAIQLSRCKTTPVEADKWRAHAKKAIRVDDSLKDN